MTYLLGLLVTVVLFYMILKDLRKNREIFNIIVQEQTRLQKIMDIIIITNPDRVAQNALSKIVKMSLKDIDSLDIKNFYNKCAVETLQEIKLKIRKDLTIYNQTYPGINHDITLELENLITLICTVDESSSPEYIQQIYFEIMMGLKKLC